MGIQFNCEYCKKIAFDSPSNFKRKKRHFCSTDCYSKFRRDFLVKEEQHAYKGGGLPLLEKKKRIKARSDANHAIRDGRLKRLPCEACGSKKSQAHHSDYSKPFKINWLCKKCHWQEHKIIYENEDLLK